VDLAAGAVGAGNIRPGVVSESTGGSLAILATIYTHDLDPTGKLPVNVHVVPGAFFFVAVCSTGGMALRWFRDQFAQSDDIGWRNRAPSFLDGRWRQERPLASN